MDEIIIPTFISPQLFWIVEKKDILLRNAFNRYLNKVTNPTIQDFANYIGSPKLIVINIDGIWARATLHQIIKNINEGEYSYKLICWLVDYGVMVSVNKIYKIPIWMEPIRHFAKQGSLWGVVNFETKLTHTEELDFTIARYKTIYPVEAVRNLAKSHLEEAEKLFFKTFSINRNVLYGDIICLRQNKEEQSLEKFLTKKNMIVKDEVKFEEVEIQRDSLFQDYFKCSGTYQTKLILDEKLAKKDIIFNSEQNKSCPMDYFDRKYKNRNQIYE